MAITPLPAPPDRSSPSDFSIKADAFLGALPTFVTEANAQAAALTLNATTDASTTSNAIATGAKTFTVTTGKSFQPGMWLMIADTAAPSTNWMYGQVTSYSSTTLVMNITQIGGSGTKTAWVISFSAPSGPAPVGEVKMWPSETVPSGYLECNGASLVRATYAGLFAVISTLYGTADGTHFNLPDLRGRFPRFWDHAKALDPDRATRTAPTAAGATITAGDHVGTQQVDEFKTHTHPISVYDGTGGGAYPRTADGVPYSSAVSGNTGGNETRPVNTNLMPIIKY